jgi:hypothetical protein
VPLEEPELDEIAATIHTDAHLEQFQEAALRQKNPRGWRVFVKIARECVKRQDSYGKVPAGAGANDPDDYWERRAAEIYAERRGENGNG